MRPHKFSRPSAPTRHGYGTRHETTTTDMPDEGNDPIRSPAPSPEQRPARGTAHTPGLPGRTMVDPNARVHTRQNPATVIARNERDAKITKIPSSPVNDPTGTGTQPSKPGIVMAGMAGCGENPPDDGSTHIQAATAGPKQRIHDMGRSDPDRTASGLPGDQRRNMRQYTNGQVWQTGSQCNAELDPTRPPSEHPNLRGVFPHPIGP